MSLKEEFTQNQSTASKPHWRIGAVSYFNAEPLIFALHSHPQVNLQRFPPALLADELDQQRIDVALAPSIDYQRTDHDWLILPVSAIASDGPVLTVRVFSHQPVEQIDTLFCDTDSHTSVALARIIWKKRFGKNLRVQPLKKISPPEDVTRSGAPDTDAILLIGDKVLPHLHEYPCQLDLGQAWKELTSLPFVYAFWTMHADNQHLSAELVQMLNHASQQGRANLKQIIQQTAADHGFSERLAFRYLIENIQFNFGPAEQAGLEKFYQLAHQTNVQPFNRPLTFYQPQSNFTDLSCP
ncbi:MAG: menaquinone biosynthesis protein [Sedimentisphaerales bacterium]|nr:menaquinone biosynthesis protein [Sedimentisphaerales bacterium]